MRGMIETRSVTAQLVEHFQQEFASGQWRAGQQFPSERMVASKYRISRTSANKAVAILVSEGWLEIRRGQGTFVTERPGLLASLRRLDSFTDYARAQGFVPKTLVVSLERMPAGRADARVRAALCLEETGRLLRMERVRLADEDPVIFEERWLPAQLYPRLTLRHCEGSFYGLARQRYDLQLAREEVVVRAKLPCAPAQKVLNPARPCLWIEGTGYLEDDRPAWYQQLQCDGDRFALSTSLGAAGTQAEIAFESAN